MLEEKQTSTIEASWDEPTDNEEVGEAYREPGISGLEDMITADELQAQQQPHVYQIDLPNTSYARVRGARYVVMDNGRLVVCARSSTFVDGEPEYEEIATYANGMWAGISILNYLV